MRNGEEQRECLGSQCDAQEGCHGAVTKTVICDRRQQVPEKHGNVQPNWHPGYLPEDLLHLSERDIAGGEGL